MSDTKYTYGTEVFATKRNGSETPVIIRAQVGTENGKYIYMVDKGSKSTYKPAKAAVDYTTCKHCSAKCNVKDHGTWIGYYCPACGTGGSTSK